MTLVRCPGFASCGETIQAKQGLCESCLDAARAADAGRNYDHYPDWLEERLE